MLNLHNSSQKSKVKICLGMKNFLPSNPTLPRIQVRALRLARLRPVVNNVQRLLPADFSPDRSAAVLSFFVHRVKLHVGTVPTLFIGQPLLPVTVDDTLAREHARFFRRFSLTHPFHNHHAAAVDEIRFAAPRRAGRADFIIAVQPRANDRRITDTSGNLVRQTARRRDAGKIAVGIDRAHVNRAGVAKFPLVETSDVLVFYGMGR